MSPHLHIQLSRHQKTTRRSRWVVWLLGVLFVIFVLFVFQMSHAWFTRTSLFLAAPEGTRSVIQLYLNKRTISVWEKALLSTPLISNRNLTLTDIAPFVTGEIVWFIEDNNHRSIGIRSREALLPRKLLDSLHITTQQISKTTFLLSEKLQPITGIQPKRPIRSLIPALFFLKLGTYSESDWKKWSKIVFNKKNKVSIDFPGISNDDELHKFESLPEGVYLFLSTPVSTKRTDNFDFTVFLSAEVRSQLTAIFKKSGVFMLQGGEEPHFLYASDEFVDEKARVQLIQTMLSLRYPLISNKLLEDKTIMQELVADPTTISVEQKTIDGREFNHATLGGISLFSSISEDFLLSDSENLLQRWQNPNDNENLSQTCNGNIGYLSMKEFLTSDMNPPDRFSQDVFMSLSTNFSAVGLEQTGESRKLHLCF